MRINGITMIFYMLLFSAPNLSSQVHGNTDRGSIDKMRDIELQPEMIMDAIKLKSGMIVGEAGAGYGYFTLYLSKRVGDNGLVYANDIDPASLQEIRIRCESGRIANIRTVPGTYDDPLFPVKNIDMVIVFDCFFEFSQPAAWMKNTRKYLKHGGKLIIIDPDPSKIKSEHFLSRKQINDFADESGYSVSEADDSFLKSHMIIVMQPKIMN